MPSSKTSRELTLDEALKILTKRIQGSMVNGEEQEATSTSRVECYAAIEDEQTPRTLLL